MNQVFGAAADGQEQLPEHATVTSALPSYLPASQLLQFEAPASEYLPAGHDEQVDDEFAPTANEYVPAGHREHVPVVQLPTKPAPVPDESLVNLTRMYPVVDVQLRLDEMLLPLSDASSDLDSHDVAPSDDEQL